MTGHRQRVHVTFRKDGGARYLSHLDLMATLEFSIRRAHLPVELSEGFSPRPRISLVAPLVLGHVGEREILEMTLREAVPPEDIRDRLQSSVPAGITVYEVVETPIDAKAAAHLRSATYRVALPRAVPDLHSRVETLLLRDTISVEEERDGKPRTRDLRPLLLTLEAPTEGLLRMTLAMTGEGTVRPEQVLDLLGIARDDVAIVREKIDFD
jgi:radical SAM-linked protein